LESWLDAVIAIMIEGIMYKREAGLFCCERKIGVRRVGIRGRCMIF